MLPVDWKRHERRVICWLNRSNQKSPYDCGNHLLGPAVLSIFILLLLHPFALSPLIRVRLKINVIVKIPGSPQTVSLSWTVDACLHSDMEVAIWARWKWTLTFRWKYLNSLFLMTELLEEESCGNAVTITAQGLKTNAVPIFTGFVLLPVYDSDRKC